MGVKYAAGFDLNNLTALYGLSITLTQATKTNIVITPADFSPDLIAHAYVLSTATTHDGTALFSSTWNSATFAAALTTAINDEGAAVAFPWTVTVTVAFSTTTNRYTISGTGTFGVTFSNTPSRLLLGYTGNLSAASSYVATLTPSFWIDATLDGRSLDREGDFEPESIASISISDDGTGYSGISRTSTPKYRSWIQPFELKRKVFKASNDGTDIWTFEDLWEHCRCEMPFVVDDGTDSMVCVFLPEGATFSRKQRPGGPADDVHMSLPFDVWHAADTV